MGNFIAVKLDSHGIMPAKAHPDDAGYDIFAPYNFTVWAGCTEAVGTGVHMAIPRGYYGDIKTKSSMNVRRLETTGVIDSGYTGEITVVLHNYGSNNCAFKRGDKIAQLIITQCESCNLVQVDRLEPTDRGDGGFGSTGK